MSKRYRRNKWPHCQWTGDFGVAEAPALNLFPYQVGDVLVVLLADVLDELAPQERRLRRERPGAENVLGSSMMWTISMWPMSVRVMRSVTFISAECGMPAASIQVMSFWPTVSTTSVSPSQWPIESPSHVSDLRIVGTAVQEDLAPDVRASFVDDHDHLSVWMKLQG